MPQQPVEPPAHLSLIIATLARPDVAIGLAQRVFELLPELKVEAIVVQPPGSAAMEAKPGVRFVKDPGRGVYPAYRAGLKAARGEYCWLMGDDDHPMQDVAQLQPAMLAGQTDLLVAPVVFSTGRLYRPTRSLLILHFLNWCQQGVIYRRRLLERRPLYRSLRVQADQFVNIMLRSDSSVRIAFFRAPICVFGVGGISGRLRDTRYASLRIALARRTLGPASYVMFRLLLLVQPLVKRLVSLR